MQLYAKWDALDCTLIFDAGEYGVMDDDEETLTANYGAPLITLPVPVPVEGREFVAWTHGGVAVTDEMGNVLEDKDELTSANYTFTDNTKVTFVATYKVQTFTYTFDYQDLDYENKTGTVEYGTTYGEIKGEFPPLIDTGSRELIGWSVNENTFVEAQDTDAITAHVTLYAFWKDYKNFYFVESQGAAPVPVKVYRGDSSDSYQPLPRNGYEFIGWYTTPHYAGNPVQGINYYSGTSTYYAKWEMETYTLQFETNNDQSFDPVYYTIEDHKVLPTPTKENFTFIGWCMEEDLSDTPKTEIVVGSYGNATLYAKYKQFIDNCFKLLPRQALHAKTLGLEHPVTGKHVFFETQLPADMTALIEKWRKYANVQALEEDDED